MTKMKKKLVLFSTLCLLVVIIFCRYIEINVFLREQRKVLFNANSKITDQGNSHKGSSINMKRLSKPKHESSIKSGQSNIQEKCEQRFPQAILVGSQKSGTGALLNFLDYHPQIAACLHPPEPRYFSRYYKNSFEWYRSKMPCSTADQVTIEKTPEYLYGNKSAERIKMFNSQMKILIILKDPLEVSLSMYTMWKSFNRSEAVGKTFEDMVMTLGDESERIINPDSRIINLATYVLHLQIWFQLYQRDQILVLDGMAFEIEPSEELNKVEKFLGISEFFNEDQFVFNETKNKFCFLSDQFTKKCLPPNKGRTHPLISEETQKILREYFTSFNEKLVQLIGHSFVWM